MKKITIVLTLAFVSLNLFCQKSVDRIFEKYSGDDGFVCVTFSGNILNLFNDNDEKSNDHWPKNVTEVRILAQDDDKLISENFSNLVKGELDTRDYEEYMSVRKSDQDIRMYVKATSKVIHEILLIGGGNDNFIIQVKGNITYKEAEDLSSDIKRNNKRNLLSDLD